MTRNVGNWDRIARGVLALGLGVCLLIANVPLWVRVVGLGASAVYLAFTALSGTCFCYRLLGKSTCSTEGG
jgi:hypothetical protein